MDPAARIYLYAVATMSLVALAVYAVDKRAARQRHRRVRESTLHIIELLGGWPGGFAARAWLRHKSLKLNFRAVSWLIAAAHVALIAWWLLRPGSG